MKITAIAGQQTTSERTILFKTDTPPDEEVVRRAKYGNVSFRKQGDLLAVTASPLPTSAEIEKFNAIFAEVEATIKADKDKADEEHRQLLDRISEATGLPIESKAYRSGH